MSATPERAAPEKVRELSEDDLMRIFWSLKPDERQQRALTYTQWFDGIDVQVPTLFLGDLVAALREALASQPPAEVPMSQRFISSGPNAGRVRKEFVRASLGDNPIRGGQMAQGQPQGATSGVTPDTEADRHTQPVAQPPAGASAGEACMLWVHDIDGPTETIHEKREPFGEDREWTAFAALTASLPTPAAPAEPSYESLLGLAAAYDFALQGDFMKAQPYRVVQFARAVLRNYAGASPPVLAERAEVPEAP